MEITGGLGSHVVLGAVGHMPADEQAYGVVRSGGTISRVGVPQYENAPVGFVSLLGKNATLTVVRPTWKRPARKSWTAPSTRAASFDREMPLTDIAEACRLMDTREA